ncbi:metallophosphoesterase [Methylobacterium sp. SI9]|uniref:metallophosphoesterase n=1 Tax=Methylobacterium guangdongense TaxID=3138811 RepID=UPI00313B1829
MPDSSLFTLLHISDFHFSKRRQREQGIVVDALIKDLKTLCIGHRKPDLIMFTGDLVQAAGIDGHDEAYDFLIDRVSKATGCSDERIFIAAGNHDLSWSGLEKHADATHEWRKIIGNSNETEKFNELHEANAFDAAVNDKFANYLELERYLCSGERTKGRKLHNSFVAVDYIPSINVDIVVFNTAVLSAGGHKSFEEDSGKLVVPEYAVMEAMGALTPGSLRIFVTHHPFAWLSERSSRYLEGEISRNAHLHLFGHMHDPQPKRIIGLKGDVIADQAGAIYSSRTNYYNGYALITLDRGEKYVETLVRSYFKDRNEFDDGIDVVEGGRWYSSQDARQHFRKIATPVDEEIFRKHLSGAALEALLAREKTEDDDEDIHTRFVAPPMRRTFIDDAVGDEAKVEIETAIPFKDIINGDSNLIVYARAEYGRTTILKEIRYQILQNSAELKFPRLPMMIDFGDISISPDNMLRKIKSGSELPPDGNDVESLLKLSYACVLIDDVQFSDIRRMRILREFVARFPKVRYVLSSPLWSATKMGACIDPEMPVRFDFIEIRELRRNDMRQLLAKDERCTDVETWLDRLQEEFKEINLPFTAANGSILIEILSEKYNFSPINRSVLMEQFVDSVLRKASIDQSRRETFDYTNKTDLLSHLAAWMAREEDYVPTKEAIRAEMKSYIDARGLYVNLDELLSEFLAARIFVSKIEGRLSFRYRGVLEYFIALRMTVDVEFKNWVIADERYLSYVNEIQYYAGKLRNDTQLVELISERHKAILNDALSDIGDIDLAQLDNLPIPFDQKTDGVDQVVEDIAQPPLTQQEKDEELDLDLPADGDDRQEMYRPKVDKNSDRVTLSLLLYSGLVKNMELIPDADKRRHLSTIWRGWSVLLIAALRFAPKLARERKVRINGALYEVQAPHGMSDATLLRQMMVQLPYVHVRMISNSLGTEKLERQLTEPTLSERNEPKIFDFFRTCLIADLRLSSTPQAIRNLASRLRDNKYLLWSLIVDIAHLRRLDRLKEDHFSALEDTLATAVADLRGGTRQIKIDNKRKQIARLKRERLLLKMKKDNEI